MPTRIADVIIPAVFNLYVIKKEVERVNREHDK